MKLIRCGSCRKTYDFDKSEICPDCGAFNNAQGGHSNQGMIEEDYHREKQEQERRRREHLLNEFHAKERREDIYKAEQDATKWMEEQQSPSSFRGNTFSETGTRRSKKTLVVVILTLIVLGYVVLFGIGFFGMLFSNTVWDESIEILEEEASAAQEQGLLTLEAEVNEEIPLENIQVRILEPMKLSTTGYSQLPEEMDVWAVPYEGVVESTLEEAVYHLADNVLWVETAEGELQEYWEELDFTLWDAAEEQTGYVTNQEMTDLFYEDQGEQQQAVMVFVVPKGSTPVALEINLVDYIITDGDEGVLEEGVTQQITVNF